MKTKILVTKNNEEVFIFQNLLENKLQHFNIEQNSSDNYQKICFYIKKENEVIGGIVGYIYSNLLTIETFWIDNDFRGLGFGKLLIDSLEKESKSLNCIQASLETYSFQSVSFYLKRGYEVIAQIKLRDYDKLFLLKTF